MNALIVGCSYAKGYGLPGEEKNPELWSNRLFDSGTYVKNLSRSGANNDWIFLETVGALLKNHYDVVVVSWTVIPRFNFTVGLELYSTYSMLDHFSNDVNIVGKQTFKQDWMKDIGDKLRIIHNDHWDILKLVKYINVLIEIQNSRQQAIFFVNALLPWPVDFFNHKLVTLPSDLNSYTQKILDVDRRDDPESLALYNMIHDQYRQFGGIKENHWLNLYQNLLSMTVDMVSKDNKHPGIKSQAVFAAYLKKMLEQKQNQIPNWPVKSSR